MDMKDRLARWDAERDLTPGIDPHELDTVIGVACAGLLVAIVSSLLWGLL